MAFYKLYTEVPAIYQNITHSIKAIRCEDQLGDSRDISAYAVVKNSTAVFGERGYETFNNYDVIQFAGLIAHEARHIDLYNEYKAAHWWGMFYVPQSAYGLEHGEYQACKAELETIKHLGGENAGLEGLMLDPNFEHNRKWWEYPNGERAIEQ
jgi:hypothetical protein